MLPAVKPDVITRTGSGQERLPRARASARLCRGPGRPTRTPTIFDVARAAGVSYSTVSRVVNGYAHVRDDTRQRVLLAMAELGYVAHTSARALASGRTQVIGLLAQEVDNPFFSAVIRGVDQQVSALDYDFLAVHHAHPAREGGRVRRAPVARHGGRPAHRAAARPAGLRRAARAPTRSPSCSSTTTSERPAATWSTPPTAAAPGTPSATSSGSAIGASASSPGAPTSAPPTSGWPATARRWRRPASRSRTLDIVVQGDFMEPRGYAAARELLALPERADRHLRVQRHGRVRRPARGPGAGLSVPARPLGGRLRRHPRGVLRDAGPDDRPSAAARDGPRRRAPAHEPCSVDPQQPPTRLVLETELVVRESTAPPP